MTELAWTAAFDAFGAEADRDAWLSDAAIEVLRREGVFGLSVPRECGGGGAGPDALLDLHRVLGRFCASTRALLIVHTMCARAIARFGQRESKTAWLMSMAKGERLAAFALSEPGVGSDIAGVQTRAEADAGGYLLHGEKTWLTWGQSADLFLVFARTQRGPTAFVVPREAAGVSVTAAAVTTGLRGARLGTLKLEGVRVSPDARVGPEGGGATFVAHDALDLGRFLVAAGLLGAMERCLDDALAEARTRTQFGHAIASHPLVRRRLTRMHARVEAARALLEKAVSVRREGGPEALMHTMTTKLLLSEWALEVAEHAAHVAGARGLVESSSFARHLRDARVASIIEGTTELLEDTLGQALAGGVA